jgi:rRNA maturation RNase YbeY
MKRVLRKISRKKASSKSKPKPKPRAARVAGPPRHLGRGTLLSALEGVIAEVAPKLEDLAGGQIDFALVGESQIRTLNRKYRKKNKSTDVLSFPTPEVFRALGYLGEVVISTPVLRRQAAEQGHIPEIELLILMVHGTAHLCGFDHERSAEDARKQRALEKRWLAAFTKAFDLKFKVSGLVERFQQLD